MLNLLNPHFKHSIASMVGLRIVILGDKALIRYRRVAFWVTVLLTYVVYDKAVIR